MTGVESQENQRGDGRIGEILFQSNNLSSGLHGTTDPLAKVTVLKKLVLPEATAKPT